MNAPTTSPTQIPKPKSPVAGGVTGGVAGGVIGARLPRKEDVRLLTGRGTYVDDVVLPGMLHGAFIRSSIACGAIRNIDVSAALDFPGVRAVYTGKDLEAFNIQMLSTHMVLPPPGPKVHPLALDRVAFVGDPVALVVAESRYIAEDAAELVVVDINAGNPVVTIGDARESAPVHPDLNSNIAAAIPPGHSDNPDLEAALAGAPHLITTEYRHQRVAHCSMETRGVVVTAHGEDELTVYISCQGPQVVARYLALAFNIPEARIRVISKDVGGAFGLKSQPWREEVAVIAAGMLLKRPIKWIEDRFENLTGANQAREQECTMRLAFDGAGKIVAAHADYATNNGAYPHYPDANAAAMMFLWASYRVPLFGFKARGFYSNTPGLAPYRGPWAIESLARETTIDIAARQMGMDPIDLRRNNLITAADQPYPTMMGIPLVDITPAECLEHLLTKIDVAAFRAEQTAARAEGRYLGLGIATYIEPTATSMFALFASEAAQLRIEPTGKVTAVMGTHSQGQGTETTMAQVVAEHLGVPFADVIVLQDDSSRGGFGGGAGGSRQAVTGGGAAVVAAGLLADKVKLIAAHLLQVDGDAIVVANGSVGVDGNPEKSMTLRQLAEVAYNTPGLLPPGMEPGLEAQYRYHAPPITFSSAAHACFVEVDIETGFVSIQRWVCAEDCGVVINPSIVEGQIAGGIAQAIGSVLLEEMHFDAQGTPTAATFKDYSLPAAVDIPDIEFSHIVTPSSSPGGFRGVGEGGNIIGPPTLVNAIADALSPFNVRCLDLPLTPSKLLALIQASGPGR